MAVIDAPAEKRPRHDVQGSYSLALDEDVLVDAAELKARLIGVFRSPKYRPPVLPAVAIELTELTRKPTVAYDDLLKVLEHDPLIAASVLRVAQSPAYGSRSPVKSLKDALHRLGINGLRDIVWQVVTEMRLFRVKDYAPVMTRLQAHSMFTAHVARLISASAGVHAEHAFLCGLLHDIGISGTLIAVCDARPKHPPDVSLLWPALEEMHSEAANVMTHLWGLSAEVCAAVGTHHHPGPASGPGLGLASVVCIAERIVSHLGWGIIASTETNNEPPPIDRISQTTYAQAVERLGLKAAMPVLIRKAMSISTNLGGPPG